MQLQQPHISITITIRNLWKKIPKNYFSWCAYMGRKSHIEIKDRKRETWNVRKELLYTSLYLLIWGEFANLRFLPECSCYIFHHMALELNSILENNTGQTALPAHTGENAFFHKVVTPLYDIVKKEQSFTNKIWRKPPFTNQRDVNIKKLLPILRVHPSSL